MKINLNQQFYYWRLAAILRFLSLSVRPEAAMPNGRWNAVARQTWAAMLESIHSYFRGLKYFKYQLLDPLWTKRRLRDQTQGGPEIKLQESKKGTPEINLLKTKRSLRGRPPRSKRRLRGRPLRLPQVEQSHMRISVVIVKHYILWFLSVKEVYWPFL